MSVHPCLHRSEMVSSQPMTLTDPLPDRLHQLPQQGLEEGGVEAVGIIMEEVSNALEGVDNEDDLARVCYRLLTDLLAAVSDEGTLALLGDHLLDLLPLLLPLTISSEEAAGVLAPAICRALVSKARPREALTAVLEALTAEAGREAPAQLLLLLQLLQLLPSILHRLPRRKLESALSALRPMISLASHIGHTALTPQCARLAASAAAGGNASLGNPTPPMQLPQSASRPASMAQPGGAVQPTTSTKQTQLPVPTSRSSVAGPQGGNASHQDGLGQEEEEALEQLCALMVKPVVEVAHEVVRDVIVPELQSLSKSLGAEGNNSAAAQQVSAAATRTIIFCLQLAGALLPWFTPHQLAHSAAVRRAVGDILQMVTTVLPFIPLVHAPSPAVHVVDAVQALPVPATPAAPAAPWEGLWALATSKAAAQGSGDEDSDEDEDDDDDDEEEEGEEEEEEEEAQQDSGDGQGRSRHRRNRHVSIDVQAVSGVAVLALHGLLQKQQQQQQVQKGGQDVQKQPGREQQLLKAPETRLVTMQYAGLLAGALLVTSQRSSCSATLQQAMALLSTASSSALPLPIGTLPDEASLPDSPTGSEQQPTQPAAAGVKQSLTSGAGTGALFGDEGPSNSLGQGDGSPPVGLSSSTSRSSGPWAQLQAVSAQLLQQCTAALPLASCGALSSNGHREDSGYQHLGNLNSSTMGVSPDTPASTSMTIEDALKEGGNGSLRALHAALRLVCIQVVHSPSDELRTSAFRSLNDALTGLPPLHRCAMLLSLLKEPSPELVALLLQRVRQEVAGAHARAAAASGGGTTGTTAGVSTATGVSTTDGVSTTTAVQPSPWLSPLPVALACNQLVRALVKGFGDAQGSHEATGARSTSTGGSMTPRGRQQNQQQRKGQGQAQRHDDQRDSDCRQLSDQQWFALLGSPACCDVASAALSLLRLILLQRNANGGAWTWQQQQQTGSQQQSQEQEHQQLPQQQRQQHQQSGFEALIQELEMIGQSAVSVHACMHLLRGGVLKPLVNWLAAPAGSLAQLQKDAQAANAVLQQQQEMRDGSWVMPLYGLAPRAPNVVPQSANVVPGAVGVLPEAVQLYTALSRLQEVAVAVLELLG